MQYGFCIYLFLFSTEMLRIVNLLFPIQVLVAVILLPVKLSCSRFTTMMDIILSS